MNERIKELAISTGIFDSLCDPFDQLKTGDYYSSVMVDLEKFAKLIVKEVDLTIGDLIDFTDYPNDTEKQMVEIKTLRDARQVIKEHFGVE